MKKYGLTYWHDGEECDPPEPGKGWIEICELDEDGIACGEIAVVVNRMMDNPGVCDWKVKQAQMIVDALNLYAKTESECV
jgi:hypothetical protein